jgi:hypothetical protein
MVKASENSKESSRSAHANEIKSESMLPNTSHFIQEQAQNRDTRLNVSEKQNSSVSYYNIVKPKPKVKFAL